MANPRGSSGRKSRPSKKDQGSGQIILGLVVGGGVAAVVGVVVFLLLNRGSSETPVAAAPEPAVQTAATLPTSPVTPSIPVATLPPTTPALATIGNATGPGIVANPVMTPLPANTSLASQGAVLPSAGGANSEKTAETSSGATMNMETLVKKTDPSVVRINVKSPRGDSLGSGFVVTDDGTVVTNYHVIEGGQTVTVEFEDKRTCNVLGFRMLDQERDIAIIQLDSAGKPFIPIKLATALPPKGAEVAAFGAPLGLSFTATKGSISNIRAGKEMGMKAEFYLQTDTPISPGNSGGPLVNMAGQVVGMNSFQLREGQNLNFAVSVDDIRQVLKSSEQKPVEVITPQSVPSHHAEMPQFADISGTERADKLLAQMQGAAIFIKPFEIDPSGRINEFMFDKFKKTVKTRLKMDLTRVNKLEADESMIILGVMWSPPEDEKQQERLGSQLSLELFVVMLDVTKEGNRVPSIVWKDTSKLAVLSIGALAKGTLTKSVQEGTQKFFDKFVTNINKARKAHGSGL